MPVIFYYGPLMQTTNIFLEKVLNIPVKHTLEYFIPSWTADFHVIKMI